MESGTWRVLGYRNDVDKHEHIALVLGDVRPDESVLVRMHSHCVYGDVFGWTAHESDMGGMTYVLMKVNVGLYPWSLINGTP